MNIEKISEKWDLVVIGGGITGMGVLRESVRNGFKTLLVEQEDFAWGTSSRSSKLVHGGLRYLKEGQFLLTFESVNERERLLDDAPGLVEPLDFLIPIYKDRGPSKWVMKAGLTLYDIIARKLRHKYYNKNEILASEPSIRKENLQGGFKFMDAQVDDARLVLRLLNESAAEGGEALNYCRAEEILRNEKGQVKGLLLKDTETGFEKKITAGAIINATGAWAEKLHSSPDKKLHIRPLRGSHLIFPKNILPVNDPVSFFHPEDKRPMFAVPWEGAVLIGTTDIDHDEDMYKEPYIHEDEVKYIIEGASHMFPEIKLRAEDAVSALAGVRPVLSEGKVSASKESREHVVWVDKGLVTITGGKLTTFRKLAWDTLKVAKKYLPAKKLNGRKDPVFEQIHTIKFPDSGLSETQIKRLYGRYGNIAGNMIKNSGKKELDLIPGTKTIWAELPHAAKYENIRHLKDLMLRRVRIGILLPEGGLPFMEKIKELCAPVLPWDNTRWDQEIEDYKNHWENFNKVPEVK